MLSRARIRVILAPSLAAAILDGLVEWIVPRAGGAAVAFGSVAVINLGRELYPAGAHERIVLVQLTGLAVVAAMVPLWAFRRRVAK